MKAEKTFDFIEMMAGIQERLLREVAELGEEARKRRAERLSRDPVLWAASFRRRKRYDNRRWNAHQPSKLSLAHPGPATFETPDARPATE
jgi:hypothetical protein